VSKASVDFPDPLTPVMTTMLSRGMSRLTFLRLCCDAPLMRMNFIMTQIPRVPLFFKGGGKGDLLFF